MNRYAVIVPNLLSFSRLVFALIFPFSPESTWIWLVVGAGFSDVLDGYLARKWKVESWQGGLLDAVADKLFVLIALSTLVGAAKFSFWWMLSVIARDLVVAGTAVYAAVCKLWSSFRQMDVRWLGKAATGGQFALFTVALLFPQGTWFVLWLAAIISILAACDYGYLFLLALQKRRKRLRQQAQST